MGNLAITYHHIADILSFETLNTTLEKTLSDPDFDWDAIVVEGSKHLVLPTIYCRLKSKTLLNHLPKELNVYLKEITEINRNRNTSIIRQAKSLSQLLANQEIEHVFLKGTALLISGCYEDVAERMVGDIDILIANHQLDLAFTLLKSNGYEPIEQTFGATFFEHKHLPRLKTSTNICAVELHRKLFVSHKDAELKNFKIIKERQKNNEVSIPSKTHLLRHNILNYQINDKGNLYNSISFRSAYDTIVMYKKGYFKEEMSLNISFKKYFAIAGLFFEDVRLVNHKKLNFTSSFYLFKIKHLMFYKFWNKILEISHFTPILLTRLRFICTNKAYRKAVFDDRKRVYKYFMSILNNS